MKTENSPNPRHTDAPFPKEEGTDSSKKESKKSFLDILKKVGFSVWLTVMVIGGVLAFLTSLLLL